MDIRAKTIRFVGTVEHHHQAVELLVQSGDAALVFRGCARSVVMACPDGCGEILTINLDDRSGKAWELYGKPTALTLFPSIWRSTGCESHFVVWRGKIDWLSGDFWDPPEDLLDATLNLLSRHEARSYYQIAKQLGELPWDVAAACRVLVRRRQAIEGKGKQRGSFIKLE